MDASLLLADAANFMPDGRVNALGLGWNQTRSPTPPAALVLLLSVDWNETNRQIPLAIELVDADGRPVTPPGAGGPVRIEALIEAGRPPGFKPGSVIQQGQAIPVWPGMHLDKGQSYEWRLTIDGEHREHWSARFTIRSD